MPKWQQGQSGFSRGVGASDPGRLIDYLLNLDNLDQTLDFRKRVRNSASEISVRKVAEVGCGIGTLLGQLAAEFPEKSFVGFDRNADLVDEAVRICARPERAHFAVAEGHDLPLRSHSIDLLIIERVLQHSAQPEAIVFECRRVLRQGGVLQIYEPDWSAMEITHPDPEMTTRIMTGYRNAIVSHAIGRELDRLLEIAGFSNIQVEQKTWNLKHPLSASVLGLSRCVELGELSFEEGEIWIATFHAAKAGLTLPFYYVTAKA